MGLVPNLPQIVLFIAENGNNLLFLNFLYETIRHNKIPLVLYIAENGSKRGI